MPVLLALAGLLAAAGNWLSAVSLLHFTVLVPGIAASILLARLSVRTPGLRADYLQTGEAAAAFMAAFIADRVSGGSLVIAIPASLAALTLYESYLAWIARRTGDAIIHGAAMNLVAASTIAYLALRDAGTGVAADRIMTGLLADAPAGIAAATFLMGLATLAFVRFGEEAGLRGQGRAWYHPAAPSWLWMGRGLTAARIILAGTAILCLGCLGGTACAIAQRHRDQTPLTLIMVLALFCQAQMLIMVQGLAGTWLLVCLSLGISYLLHGLWAGQRRDLYDRHP